MCLKMWLRNAIKMCHSESERSLMYYRSRLHSTSTIIHNFCNDISASIYHLQVPRLDTLPLNTLVFRLNLLIRTQFPRTSFPIQLRHQVSLADHTKSPSPAESLLGPKCRPTQAPSSPRSTNQPAQPPTLPPFPVEINSSSCAAPASSFSTRPKPLSGPKARSAHHSLVFPSFEGPTSH